MVPGVQNIYNKLYYTEQYGLLASVVKNTEHLSKKNS